MPNYPPFSVNPDRRLVDPTVLLLHFPRWAIQYGCPHILSDITAFVNHTGDPNPCEGCGYHVSKDKERHYLCESAHSQHPCYRCNDRNAWNYKTMDCDYTFVKTPKGTRPVCPQCVGMRRPMDPFVICHNKTFTSHQSQHEYIGYLWQKCQLQLTGKNVKRSDLDTTHAVLRLELMESTTFHTCNVTFEIAIPLVVTGCHFFRTSITIQGDHHVTFIGCTFTWSTLKGDWSKCIFRDCNLSYADVKTPSLLRSVWNNTIPPEKLQQVATMLSLRRMEFPEELILMVCQFI